MASNVSGIAITIRAFLPTGKTLDEQFEALSLVKAAHASGDYSALLEAAKIDEVKTEQKVRRVEDQPAAIEDEPTADEIKEDEEQPDNESVTWDDVQADEQPGEADDVPAFLKGKRKTAA